VVSQFEIRSHWQTFRLSRVADMMMAMEVIYFDWVIGQRLVAFAVGDKLLSNQCSSGEEVDFAAGELKRHIDIVAARMKLAIEMDAADA
jgi:hypothetical protein